MECSINGGDYTPPEQTAYANLLFWGSWFAILIMIITYFVYTTGIAEPFVPLRDISQYWTQPVHTYVEETGIPTGWGWVVLLGKGDFLNFVGIVILAAMTVLCFITSLLPAYFKKKDWVFFGIVILEVLVLSLAASGILGSGGH